jgi:peptidoglycan/LPS O-acetylase OafA/YrhL
MMWLVTLLCALGAAALMQIVVRFSSLSLLAAFLLSLLVVLFTSGALAAKKVAAEKRVSVLAKLPAVILILLFLTPSAKPYLSLWQSTAGFWSKAFLVWLAILALMLITVPAQAGEERT